MTVGPHLLGRVPSPPDPRDYQLAAFLSGDPLDAALAVLLASHSSAATKAWAKLVTARLRVPDPTPAPIPPPTPAPPPAPAGDVLWADKRQLDQGPTPHCVGFGWAQWGNSAPIEDSFADADGHAIYYECKAIDGEAGQEDGSSVRSGAQAMLARGRLSAYAFAASVDEMVAWVLEHGPVVVGTDWTSGMFSPSSTGLVVPSGQVEGGHCYVLAGVAMNGSTLEFQNSWGSSWGLGGRFWMHRKDFAELYADGGEACAAVELA